MEVIIGLHAARRASLPTRHRPAKPAFLFPRPIKTLDLLSPLNCVPLDLSPLGVNCNSAAACAAECGLIQRAQFELENANA
jgi:hypothetical protein